jgi:hypothetical protein
MNEYSDVERVLNVWFDDGPRRMPDRVVTVVADRIGHTRQRRTWRLQRRLLDMNQYLKLSILTAALVVVAVAGLAVLRPSSSGIGGPSATESPPTSPSPAVSPAAVECEDGIPGCLGPLVAGVHRSNQFQPGFSYGTTNAALGDWLNVIDSPEIYKIDEGDPNDPYVLMWSDASIPDQSDPCTTNPDPSLGRKAADWIAFLTNHPGLDASEPVDVDFGSVTGQQVELTVAHSWTTSCPDHPDFYVDLLTQPIDGRPNEYGLPSSRRILMTVVDVGDRTVVMQSYAHIRDSDFTGKSGNVRDVIATFRFD